MEILGTKGVCKDFGPVRVLFDIDTSFTTGKVHAVIGENGAGKSTLMKILSGFLQPTEGTVLVDGKEIDIPNNAVGEQLGIVLIHQEFNLAKHLTVEQNIFLGRERRKGFFLDKRSMASRVREILAELQSDIDPGARVMNLSFAQQQIVEIAKAVSRNARILIMDEPTSTLTPAEIDVLFDLIHRLKRQQVTVLYISHKLEEVVRIADEVTVLRDGYLVATQPIEELTQHEMANLMVGRELGDMYPDKHSVSDEQENVLEVSGVTVPAWAENVSFELRRGEILGFAGLVGAGRTELMEGIVGLRRRVAGTVKVNGKERDIHTYKDAVRLGIAYVSEDRKGKGVIAQMKLAPNVTLMTLKRFCRPFIDSRKELAALKNAVDRFSIQVKRLDTTVRTLSGGNQQKLVLAKIAEVDPHIIILDEPTRGIDVGTKREIYHLIAKLARSGQSCIVVSSELTELIGLCHRVIVMRSGRVTGVLYGDHINEQEIVYYATGIKQQSGVVEHADED